MTHSKHFHPPILITLDKWLGKLDVRGSAQTLPTAPLDCRVCPSYKSENIPQTRSDFVSGPERESAVTGDKVRGKHFSSMREAKRNVSQITRELFSWNPAIVMDPGFAFSVSRRPPTTLPHAIALQSRNAKRKTPPRNSARKYDAAFESAKP